MNDYTDSLDLTKPLFDQLVGEGKPFADAEAFAASKIEGNITIRERENELARLRADLETRMNYEEFLEHFKEKAPINAGNHTAPTGQTNPQTPTLQDIERIVEQREQAKARDNNLNTALGKYAEVNGPNFALKLKQQATDLGMTEQQLKDMAANNPKLFYRATGVEETQQRVDNFQLPPRTQVNSESLGSTNKQNKEAEYFKELYRTKPNEYWSPTVQNKIMDAVKAGRLDPDDVI